MTATATVINWFETTVRTFNEGLEPELRRGWLSSAQPLLAVFERQMGEAKVYGVVHTSSAWSCARYFVTRGAAEAFLLAIADLADWSRDLDDLRAQMAANNRHLYYEVRRIRADIYRRECLGEFGAVDPMIVATIDFRSRETL